MTAVVLDNLGLLALAPGGLTKLRALIMDLAATGRLLAGQQSLRAIQLRELVVSSGAGWSPSCDAHPRSGDQWGVLKVSAVSWGQFRPEENKALPAQLAPRPELEVQPGDFLVSRANTAELVARSVVVANAPPRLMLSDKIVRLRLSAACDARFVQIANSASAARSYYARVAGGTSSSMKNVSREQILALPILLPPLAEQHRIVAKVDELMALCDRLEARQQDAEAAHARLVHALLDSLTQARDADEFQVCWQRVAAHFSDLLTTDESVELLKQAVLQACCSGRLAAPNPYVVAEPSQRYLAAPSKASQPFAIPPGWRWTRLGDLCALVTSGSRGWKDFYAEKGSTFIRSQDIKFDRLEFDQRAFVALPPNAECARTKVKQNDLLITITGANVGKAAVLTEAPDDAYVSQHVALVRLRDPQQAAYIHRWLTNSHGGRSLLLSSSYGAKPGLNLQNIKDLPVPLPPLAEQRRIVAEVTELLALCDQLKARITAARAKHAQLADALVAQATH